MVTSISLAEKYPPVKEAHINVQRVGHNTVTECISSQLRVPEIYTYLLTFCENLGLNMLFCSAEAAMKS